MPYVCACALELTSGMMEYEISGAICCACEVVVVGLNCMKCAMMGEKGMLWAVCAMEQKQLLMMDVMFRCLCIYVFVW